MNHEQLETLLHHVARRVASHDKTPVTLSITGMMATPQAVERAVNGCGVVWDKNVGLTLKPQGPYSRVAVALTDVIREAIQEELGRLIQVTVQG